MRTRILASVWMACLMESMAWAGPGNTPVATLVRGEGQETVMSYCSICHSNSYIPMNASVLDRSGWEKEIQKMVGAYGAPIPEAQQKTILEYLVRNYSVTTFPESPAAGGK
jgi:hypothetical protein